MWEGVVVYELANAGGAQRLRQLSSRQEPEERPFVKRAGNGPYSPGLGHIGSLWVYRLLGCIWSVAVCISVPLSAVRIISALTTRSRRAACEPLDDGESLSYPSYEPWGALW